MNLNPNFPLGQSAHPQMKAKPGSDIADQSRPAQDTKAAPGISMEKYQYYES